MLTFDPITGRKREFVSTVPYPANDPIARRRECDVPDAVNVPLYRSYAAGLQCNVLDDKQKEALAGLLEHDFCDNVCQPILSLAADRVELERFDVPAEVRKGVGADGTAAPNPLEVFLNELFVRTHLEAMQSVISYSVFRDGSHYIGVDWANDGSERPAWIHHPAWDGDTGMHLFYDRQGIPEFAVNEYIRDISTDANITQYVRFRVLYYRDRIEYQRVGQSGTDWEEDAPTAPWTTNDQKGGTPKGLAVFHFTNESRCGLPHGDSELSGGVIGLQDQINDAHWDLTAAGRYTAYQRTWSAGADTRDIDGNPIPLDTLPGANIGFDNDAAKMGVIPAGDCSQLINIIHEKRETACRMTGTPVHLVTVGVNSSGTAIVNAEAPLENKAKKVASKLAPAYASAAHFSVVLSNAKGQSALDESILIQAIMAPTARRDPLSLATQVQTIAPFLDEATALELLGFPPSRIVEIIAARKKEKAEALAEQIAAMPKMPATGPTAKPFA